MQIKKEKKMCAALIVTKVLTGVFKALKVAMLQSYNYYESNCMLLLYI